MIETHDKKVTIKDVAALAEVSISSVSRFLADPKSIKPFSAYRISDAIEKLKYIPNTFARNLRSRSSNVVGLIIPDLEYYYGKAGKVISDFFFQSGLVVNICVTNYNADKELFFLQQMAVQQVCGLIVTPTGFNTPYIRQLIEQGTPIVMLDCSENLPCHTVSENHFLNAYRLTRHMLKSCACETIDILLGEKGMLKTQDCLAGFEKAWQESAAVSARKSARFMHFSCQNPSVLNRAIESILGHPKGSKPAVICFQPAFLEHLVIGLNRLDRGLTAGLDLSGFAMPSSMDKLAMRIPCVAQRPEYAGFLAAQLLLSLIKGEMPAATASQIHELASDYLFETD